MHCKCHNEKFEAWAAKIRFNFLSWSAEYLEGDKELGRSSYMRCEMIHLTDQTSSPNDVHLTLKTFSKQSEHHCFSVTFKKKKSVYHTQSLNLNFTK